MNYSSWLTQDTTHRFFSQKEPMVFGKLDGTCELVVVRKVYRDKDIPSCGVFKMGDL